MNAPRLFYSTTEVAEILGCSGEHVRNLVRAGRLKAHDGLGRKILIPCSEVRRLTGEDEAPGHEVVSPPPQEVVSSLRQGTIVREIRQKYAEIGLLLAQLEEV